MNKNEKFKFYGDSHLVSNFGRVFSLKTFKFLKPYPNSNGYLRFDIHRSGERQCVFVHLAVVKLFGDCKNITFSEKQGEVDHLDRDKRNCRQDNLEIVSHQENCKRKYYSDLELEQLKNDCKVNLDDYF